MWYIASALRSFQHHVCAKGLCSEHHKTSGAMWWHWQQYLNEAVRLRGRACQVAAHLRPLYVNLQYHIASVRASVVTALHYLSGSNTLETESHTAVPDAEVCHLGVEAEPPHVFVPRLGLQCAVVDGARVHPRRRACLQAVRLKAQRYESLCQAGAGSFTRPAATQVTCSLPPVCVPLTASSGLCWAPSTQLTKRATVRPTWDGREVHTRCRLSGAATLRIR